MLIQCPECGLQASNKALSCPHCGLPFQPSAKPRTVRKSNKRRRLPNGFGQISEIKGRNLRNPFRAMVTVGKTAEGKPICKPLKPNSFFPTYNDAYAALVEYNKNPYDLDDAITMSELYDRWTDRYFKTLSESSVRNIVLAWSYCSPIYSMKVTHVRTRHLKGCLEDGTKIVKGEARHATPTMQTRIKSVFNMMLDYALEFELVDRNYARAFVLADDVIKEANNVDNEHIPFTDEEIDTLWAHVDDVLYADMILIQCYSAWRPQELGKIKIENVDLANWTFSGGMKTDAGTDRLVPIHSKIRYLVERKYNEAVTLKSKYLFNCTDKSTSRSSLKFTYGKYRERFIEVRNKLNLDPRHRPHDPRMHFITQAKKYKLDEYAIKYIAGHNISDITEKVYTKRDVEWLKEEMERIQ